MTDLTVLCVTKDEPYAQPFVQRLASDAATIGARFFEYDGSDAGYLEQVLDDALTYCETDYVLRVDDDETLSLRLLEWLRAGSYRQADHWAFPRANLWPDAQHYIMNPPLWPDLQTRLSVKEKAGGRTTIHAGSPHGTGQVAPDGCVIEHHKFLARTREAREELVAHYDRLQRRAGSNFVMFSVPEMYEPDLRTGPLT